MLARGFAGKTCVRSVLAALDVLLSLFARSAFGMHVMRHDPLVSEEFH